MSTPIKIRAESVKLLSNAEALAYLRRYEEEIRSLTGTTSPTVSRVIDYLTKFAKINIERAAELREKLASKGFKEETVIMIMNICPQTIDELRPLLELEDKVYETKFLEEVLNLLSEHCLATE